MSTSPSLSAKSARSRVGRAIRSVASKLGGALERAQMGMPSPGDRLASSLDIQGIRRRALDYAMSMRLARGSHFAAYRHSSSTTKPVLYATLAALLLKDLCGREPDDGTEEELQHVLRLQHDDGLFRDPVIQCREAETEDWWGWRHLTLHALMTLALYDAPAQHDIAYLDRFSDKDDFVGYLNSRDWGARAAWTSNEVQNLGVMLQYARDYQNSSKAGQLIDVLYDVIDAKQDPKTGLFGASFGTPEEISLGVQAGYHFWLLYFYDGRPINHIERIIDSVLLTQNRLGGYGVQWNSSACEDIDSIDPLVRLTRITDYRRDDIQASLERALPGVLHNLNPDGGWVFRRHESLQVVHRQMFSARNESNMLYTWFRTLGLAYCLAGLDDVPPELQYEWNFKKAPGHQFL